jgi:hypothetical protein
MSTLFEIRISRITDPALFSIISTSPLPLIFMHMTLSHSRALEWCSQNAGFVVSESDLTHPSSLRLFPGYRFGIANLYRQSMAIEVGDETFLRNELGYTGSYADTVGES